MFASEFSEHPTSPASSARERPSDSLRERSALASAGLVMVVVAMSSSLSQPTESVAVRTATERAPNGPPNLQEWLLTFTPNGAAAGDIHGIGMIGGRCPVPFTRDGERDAPWWPAMEDAVSLRLKAHFPDLALDRIDRLRRLIAGPEARMSDGLPTYQRSNSSREEAVEELNYAMKHQKAGADARAIVLAVETDLGANELIPSFEIVGPNGKPVDCSAARWAGLRDHEIPLDGRDHQGKQAQFASKPDKAYKVRTRGREVLAAVGAWPWTHAPNGKLPRSWQRDQTFLIPLRAWVDESLALAEQEFGAIRDSAGSPPLGLPPLEVGA